MNENLHIAIKASLEAGAAIMKIYAAEFNVEIKEDNSPLTIADKNANDIIIKHLLQTEIPIISEENKQLDFSERQHFKKCWIVDPLDGTKEFIKRNGEFTVNIALVENGEPVLGVIYIPDTKTLYYAEVALGRAYRAEIVSHTTSLDEVISLSKEISPKSNASIVRIVGSRSHQNNDTIAFIESIAKKSETQLVSKGSSLKFCLVAEGLADIYPRFAPTMEWDTAAGQAICESVGISVIDQTTKMPMRYNKPNLLNNYFVVQANA